MSKKNIFFILTISIVGLRCSFLSRHMLKINLTPEEIKIQKKNKNSNKNLIDSTNIWQNNPKLDTKKDIEHSIFESLTKNDPPKWQKINYWYYLYKSELLGSNAIYDNNASSPSNDNSDNYCCIL